MALLTRKSGTARLIVERFANGNTITIPAGFKIEAIVAKKIGTTAGNLRIGTTAGGQQVVSDTALGTSHGALVDTSVLIPGFSTDTLLFIGVSQAGATGDLVFLLRKIF